MKSPECRVSKCGNCWGTTDAAGTACSCSCHENREPIAGQVDIFEAGA